MLAAITLFVTAPIYTSAVTSLGLRTSLERQPAATTDIQVFLNSYPLTLEDYARVADTVEGKLDAALGDVAAGRSRAGQGPSMYAVPPVEQGAVLPAMAAANAAERAYATSLDDQAQAEKDLSNLTARADATAQDLEAARRRASDASTVVTRLNTESRSLRAAANALLGPDQRRRAVFRFQSGYESHVALTEGRLPAVASAPAPGQPPTFEALIGDAMARSSGIRIGDRIAALPTSREPTAKVDVLIVGIAHLIDPTEAFWVAIDPFIYIPSASEGYVTVPLIVPEETFFLLGDAFPGGSAQSYRWNVYIDPSRVTAERAGRVEGAIGGLEQNLLNSIERSRIFTSLDTLLAEYRTKLVYTRIPVYLLLFQVAGIALYYITMLSGMLVERRASEIALLKGRGASAKQIVGIHLMEGAIVCALSAAAAPFLAVTLVRELGHTSAFGGVGALPAQLTMSTFLLSTGGAVISLAALLLPVIGAARMDIVQQRQQAARPQRAPFWQRYYLDLFLLGAGGVLYYQIRNQGNLVRQSLLGDVSADPVQLLAPALLMVASAIVFLRLFPLIVSGLSRIATGAKVPILMGLNYMGRNPIPYSRLMLLLILAMSLGFFAATFGGTLTRNQEERALYQAGSDLRVSGIRNTDAGTGALLDRFRSVDGVVEVTVAYRADASVGATGASAEFRAMAVEPEAIARMAWFRKDFSRNTLAGLMREITPAEPPVLGVPLPESAAQMGVWVRAVTPCPDCTLLARLIDAGGGYRQLRLGVVFGLDWQLLIADIADASGGQNAPLPLRLQAVYLDRSGPARNAAGTIAVDELQTFTASGQPQPLEGFDEPRVWEMNRPDTRRGGDRLTIDDSVLRSGAAAGRLTWIQGSGAPGILFDASTARIPAIASASLMKKLNMRPGAQLANANVGGHTVTLDLVAEVTYFPTMDPDERDGFVLVDRDALLYQMNRRSSTPVYPNDVWVTTDGRESFELDTTTLTGATVFDRSRIVAEAAADPLRSGGLRGVLLITFLAVTALSALGLFLYTYLAAQRRQLEFAVLRTLGFSSRQISALIFFEQALLLFLGLAGGTLIGLGLSRILLPFLEITELGQPVIPPFIVTLDWSLLAQTYAILIGAFLVASVASVWFFSRLALYSALRIGER